MANIWFSRSSLPNAMRPGWGSRIKFMAGVCALTALAAPIYGEEPRASFESVFGADPLQPYFSYAFVAEGGSVFGSSFSAPMPRVAPNTATGQGGVTSHQYTPPSPTYSSPGGRESSTASTHPYSAPSPTYTSPGGNESSAAGTHQYGPSSHTPTGDVGSTGPGQNASGMHQGTNSHPAGTGNVASGAKGKVVRDQHGNAVKVTTPSGKDATGKEIAPPAEPTSLVHLGGSIGWYSLYMFRGADVGYRTGINKDNRNEGFLGVNAAVTVGDFALGFWNMNSLDPYIPGGAGLDNSYGKNSNNPLNYKTPQAIRYQEYDASANYTVHLTSDLALTTGLNFYFFNDGRFWAHTPEPVNWTGEAAATLSYTGLPFVNQSLGFAYDFEAFNGGYFEYKIAAKPIDIVNTGNFAVALVPSVGISYDLHYNNHANNDWNNVEPGLDVPIKLADGLVLDLGARWSVPINTSHADDRYWFSAAFQYSFPSGRQYAAPVPHMVDGKDGKAVLIESAPADTKWRFSLGAGVRNMNASFDVGKAPFFNLFGALGYRDAGDLGFASAGVDKYYQTGAVYGANHSYRDGTVRFMSYGALLTDDQKGGIYPGIVRQATFMSTRLGANSKGFNSNDNDAVVSPYVDLTYDLMKRGPFALSVGLGYNFNDSSMQSGSRLVGAETLTNYYYTYNLDEIYSSSKPIPTVGYKGYYWNNYYLVENGSTYSNYYTKGALPNYGPQENSITGVQNWTRNFIRSPYQSISASI